MNVCGCLHRELTALLCCSFTTGACGSSIINQNMAEPFMQGGMQVNEGSRGVGPNYHCFVNVRHAAIDRSSASFIFLLTLNVMCR